MGAGVGGAVGSQDAGHLLVQVLQGLKQAGQHEPVVVLVMQLCCPHAQHIAVAHLHEDFLLLTHWGKI